MIQLKSIEIYLNFTPFAVYLRPRGPYRLRHRGRPQLFPFFFGENEQTGRRSTSRQIIDWGGGGGGGEKWKSPRVKEGKAASQYEGAGYKTAKVIGAKKKEKKKRERQVLRKNEEEDQLVDMSPW